jgi:hypothetical protein
MEVVFIGLIVAAFLPVIVAAVAAVDEIFLF